MTVGNDGNTQGYENHAQLSVDSGQGIVLMTNGYYGRALIHAVLAPAINHAFGLEAARPGAPTGTATSSSPP